MEKQSFEKFYIKFYNKITIFYDQVMEKQTFENEYKFSFSNINNEVITKKYKVSMYCLENQMN